MTKIANMRMQCPDLDWDQTCIPDQNPQILQFQCPDLYVGCTDPRVSSLTLYDVSMPLQKTLAD